MQNLKEHSISVILPNYNGKELLSANIPPLINALENANCMYEIIVVDDCSTDDSISFLEANFPQVIIIKNSSNEGFSKTCNNGVKVAKNSLLCISNTDVIFDIDYFVNAIDHFNNGNLFALKGNIVNYKENFDDIMNIEKVSLMYFKKGLLRFNQKVAYEPGTFTGFVDGQFVLLGCVFVCSREKMLELNGFDEIFSPYYWEDADLAIRALRKGYKLHYEPKCIAYHQTSSTISSYVSNTKRRLVSIRNKFLFSWRHLKGVSQWSSHIAFLVFNLLTRWIILDWKFYVAFVNAVKRIKDLNV